MGSVNPAFQYAVVEAALATGRVMGFDTRGGIVS
jgi:hypothetical protein